MKRWIIVLLTAAFLVTLLAGCGIGSQKETASSTEGKEKEGVVRIGYQKYGTFNLLKAQGTLEKRLAKAGTKVEWTEFPGGPQLLEALNVGSIDIGHTGEAPPIFAQAAGAQLLYLAHEPPGPHGEGILVPKGSPIQTVADLKGKKVALNKGSNVHYLLVKQLEKAGLNYNEIKTVFLAPADARAAFEQGSVDAWAIWDPFLAAAQNATGATLLADGTDVVSNHEFYLASRGFATNHPEIIEALLDEWNQTDQWAKNHRGEVARLLSKQLGIDVPSLEMAAKRREYGVLPMTEEVIAEQQKIADTFVQLGLIPKAIHVKEGIWKR